MPANYSIYAPPAFAILAFLPQFFYVGLTQKTIGWDNANPRQNLDNLKEKAPEKYDIAARAAYASLNGYETFPIITSAIILGNAARLDNKLLNTAAGAFVGLRVAYNLIYVLNDDSRIGWVRSAFYHSQFFGSIWLMFKAAQKLCV